MGLPVGAELALIYGGVLASGRVPGEGKPLSLAIVIIVAILGEVLGSAAGYGIGRFGGRTLVDKVGKYVLLTHKDLDRAEAWFARRGEPVVLFGRFIPLLRSFVGLVAGIAEMAVLKFGLFTAFAAAMWCAAFALLGYGLGASWAKVLHQVSNAGYVVAVLIGIACLVLFLRRLRTVRAERAAHDQVQGWR